MRSILPITVSSTVSAEYPFARLQLGSSMHDAGHADLAQTIFSTSPGDPSLSSSLTIIVALLTRFIASGRTVSANFVNLSVTSEPDG